MSRKPETLHEQREITYDTEHWTHLDALRQNARSVILALADVGCEAYVYGSVARGDISVNSDIDVIIPHVVSSFKVELALGKGIRRELVQATPSSVMKGHLHLDADVVVSFPLFRMLSREREFYRWGGLASVCELGSGARVPGVNKKLLLIVPTETGHQEQGIIGQEWYAAKVLGVSPAIAHERVRVLTRRDTMGRTGVYRTYQIREDETFEEAAKRLSDNDPALRRTIRRRK